MFTKPLGKNELLGIMNFCFGTLYLGFQLWVIMRGVPAITNVLTGFGSNPPSIIVFYFVAAIYIIFGFLNLFLGVRLFMNPKSEVVFKQGLILFIFSILGLFIFPVIYTWLVILPIYDLTEKL